MCIPAAAEKPAINAWTHDKAVELLGKGVGFRTPGATDNLHFRAEGMPSYGVSGLYLRPTDDFAHGLNERIPVSALVDAVGAVVAPGEVGRVFAPSTFTLSLLRH